MSKKELKEKRRKRKIFLAIIMILFTGVVLTVSTYAWFSANRTVTVNQIDVNVAATNGLQISVDGTNWKTVVSNDDITGAINTYGNAKNQLPSVEKSIVPVSTIGEVDSSTGFLNMYEGTIENTVTGDSILTAKQTPTEINTTDSAKFVAFDLFFQVTEPTAIYLTDNSNVIAKGTSKGLENAARVAFLPQGTADAGSALSLIQNLKATDNTGLQIWEPNYNVHTAAAVNNAKNNYGYTDDEIGLTSSLLTYYGVKAEIPSSAEVSLDSTSDAYFAVVEPTITSAATGIPANNYAKAFDLAAGITKMRIYMWVEGQDVDCENNASGTSISYNLQFSSLESANAEG